MFYFSSALQRINLPFFVFIFSSSLSMVSLGAFSSLFLSSSFSLIHNKKHDTSIRKQQLTTIVRLGKLVISPGLDGKMKRYTLVPKIYSKFWLRKGEVAGSSFRDHMNRRERSRDISPGEFFQRRNLSVASWFSHASSSLWFKWQCLCPFGRDFPWLLSVKSPPSCSSHTIPFYLSTHTYYLTFFFFTFFSSSPVFSSFPTKMT